MRDSLFEVDYSPDWGYGKRFFNDVEHRYTKMHRLLREKYGTLDGKRIVDLGLSRGLLLERFRRYARVELGGIEIDSKEIEHARRRGLDPRRHFINVFDGERLTARLPYEGGSADVILAGEILEHIVDTEAFLREIQRTLAPSGALVLSTPNIAAWRHRVTLLAGRYPDALDYRTRYGNDLGHVRLFTVKLLERLLSETGFHDIEIVGTRLVPIGTLVGAPPMLGRLLDQAADLYPTACETLIAAARRRN